MVRAYEDAISERHFFAEVLVAAHDSIGDIIDHLDN